MKYIILTLWSLVARGSTSPEAQLQQICEQLDDSSRLLGGISALSRGQREVAASLFRDFADQLDGGRQ